MMFGARAIGGLALCLVLAAALGAPADEKWYPSKYGANDTLGAVNELTPDKVRTAAGLVKTGEVYSLGIEVSPATPAYPPRTFQIFTFTAGDGTGAVLGANEAYYNDDMVLTWVGIGSQLDGLGHLGIGHRLYNGLKQQDVMRPGGLAKLGTHLIPPIATRGVLLDVAGLKGVTPLAGGTAITKTDLEAARAKQGGVAIGKGDVVLIHTGWLALAKSDPKKFMETEPGLGADAAEYLASLGVVAVGADCWGLEAVPAQDPKQAFPVHQILLAKNGIYILENVQTAELASDSAWEFMFVLGFPKWVGAVQAMINPVAIR